MAPIVRPDQRRELPAHQHGLGVAGEDVDPIPCRRRIQPGEDFAAVGHDELAGGEFAAQHPAQGAERAVLPVAAQHAPVAERDADATGAGVEAVGACFHRFSLLVFYSKHQ